MLGFTIATLLPVPMLMLAAGLGGFWAWAALAYIALFVTLMDLLIPRNWHNRNPNAEFPAGQGLSMVLGLAHLWLVIAAIQWIGGPAGAEGLDAVIAGLAFGLYFGQVSHPNAHELIHRPARRARQLGKLVYITMLFGHHASSHPKVHHIHVASPADPNTARPGEGFYRYALRAWLGSFWAGLKAEHVDLRRAGKSPFMTPYVGYVAGAAAILALASAMSGRSGMLAFVAICALAQMQILLSDYVQHYGLRRQPGANGKLEPVGIQHSWNAPHAMSAAMMLNAPRHSDHHVHPGRSYPGLQLNRVTMPMLPYSMPVMATMAMFPTLWRRVMDPRVEDWQYSGDYHGLTAFAQESAV